MTALTTPPKSSRQRELERIYREAISWDEIVTEVANKIEEAIQNPEKRMRRKRPKRKQ